MAETNSRLTIALAQLAPVWLDRAATTEKIIEAISTAAGKGAQLVAFGEALLPGYPFWLELTGGATFNSQRQKEIHAHYARNERVAQCVGNDPALPLQLVERRVELGAAELGGSLQLFSGHPIAQYCSGCQNLLRSNAQTPEPHSDRRDYRIW